MHITLKYGSPNAEILSEKKNMCSVKKIMQCYQFLFLSIFHKKLKKTCSGQKRNNFVLILKLIFNMLTLKFWFSEINF